MNINGASNLSLYTAMKIKQAQPQNKPIGLSTSLKNIHSPLPMNNNSNRVMLTQTSKPVSYASNMVSADIGIPSYGYNDMLKDWVQTAMINTGVTLDDIDKLEIRLGEDSKFVVSGLDNDVMNQKFSDSLNTAASYSPSGKPSTKYGSYHTAMMFFQNSDYAMAADNEQERAERARLIFVKDNISAQVMKDTDMFLDFSKLYRADNGQIGGYPDEFSWYFECDLSKKPESRTESEQMAIALNIRTEANALLNAGYDNVPNINELNVVYSFKKSDFIGFNSLV